MLSILGFLAVLGPLVIFHEFGHYIFARIFNVKAEIFSIGFGPTLWKKQMGETELRLSAVPLGGYVKLLGEDGETELPPELKERALQRQAPWKRFLIFFGGPLFNFILAILVFALILVIGEPQMASVAGRVVKGSAAEQAGFRSGDRIVSINGEPVSRYEEVVLKVNESHERPLVFEVLRPQPGGEPLKEEISITPSGRLGYSVYGEQKQIGEIDGLFPTARSNQIGISDPNSPAGKIGLKTGDKLIAVEGKPVSDWETVENIYGSLTPGSTIKFKAESVDGRVTDAALVKPVKSAGLGPDLGLHSSELFVDKTVEGSPAEAAGIKPGDRLIGIGERRVQSFFELKDAVHQAGENSGKVIVHWEREGREMTADITPTIKEGRDAAMAKTTSITVGVVPMLTWAEPEMIVERIWNPFMLLYKASERMVTFSWRNIVSLKKMFTGDVSIGTLGGPILIGKLAGDSLSRGLISFLTMMGILSVGLGVLNILPIPVLDGGHLLLLAIEQVRGRPLTVRQMEIVQQGGLSLILLLMVIVMRNDIARLSIFE